MQANQTHLKAVTQLLHALDLDPNGSYEIHIDKGQIRYTDKATSTSSIMSSMTSDDFTTVRAAQGWGDNSGHADQTVST